MNPDGAKECEELPAWTSQRELQNIVLKVILAMWDLCLRWDSMDSLDENDIFLQCVFLQIHLSMGS